MRMCARVRRTIHGLIYNALKIMMEMNQKLFDECNERFRVDEAEHGPGGSVAAARRRSEQVWSHIVSRAKSNPLVRTSRTCPYFTIVSFLHMFVYYCTELGTPTVRLLHTTVYLHS